MEYRLLFMNLLNCSSSSLYKSVLLFCVGSVLRGRRFVEECTTSNIVLWRDTDKVDVGLKIQSFLSRKAGRHARNRDIYSVPAFCLSCSLFLVLSSFTIQVKLWLLVKTNKIYLNLPTGCILLPGNLFNNVHWSGRGISGKRYFICQNLDSLISKKMLKYAFYWKEINYT